MRLLARNQRSVRRSAARGLRRGFTLIEVLLVLALAVAVTAVALPALGRPWASQRLRSAADLIRAEWTRARFKAISTGQTVVFRYTPEGNRYLTEVCATDDFSAWAGEFGALGQEDYGFRARCEERVLPQGVTFVGAEVQADTRTEATDAQLAPSSAEWSDAICFYADGTASTARLVLTNEYSDWVEVTLRGLTGVITTGDVRGGQP